MGNCLVGGMGGGSVDRRSVIRVATSNGGIMEFAAPITVESITDEFPGHGIFRSRDLFWKPLHDTDILLVGEFYHLLPLLEAPGAGGGRRPRVGHVRSNSAPPSQLCPPPYRMSFNSRGLTKRSPTNGTASTGPKARVGMTAHCAFWKVKLVISPEQLVEILAEEGRTEELIESVRTVAKCGSGLSSGGGWFSDQWSLSSSRNAASANKDALLEF